MGGPEDDPTGDDTQRRVPGTVDRTARRGEGHAVRAQHARRLRQRGHPEGEDRRSLAGPIEDRQDASERAVHEDGVGTDVLDRRRHGRVLIGDRVDEDRPDVVLSLAYAGVLRPLGQVQVGAAVVVVGRAAERTEVRADRFDALPESRAGDHRHRVPLAHEMAGDLEHRSDVAVDRVRRQENGHHGGIHFVRFGL